MGSQMRFSKICHNLKYTLNPFTRYIFFIYEVPVQTALLTPHCRHVCHVTHDHTSVTPVFYFDMNSSFTPHSHFLKLPFSFFYKHMVLKEKKPRLFLSKNV